MYGGEPFRADRTSMQMAEYNIESKAELRKTVRLYAKFFENQDRCAKLKRIGRSYQTPLALHTDIMAVLCGLNGGTSQEVIIAVLSAGLERESNPTLENISKFGNIEAFWQLVRKFTGYVDADDRPLGDLAVHILLTALSQTMNGATLKGLERFISESCTAYCFQLVREWQYLENGSGLYEICRYVENELRLAGRFDKTDVDILLKSDIFPAIPVKRLRRKSKEGLPRSTGKCSSASISS